MALFQTTMAAVPEVKVSGGKDFFAVGTLPELLDRCATMSGTGRQYSESQSRDHWAGGIGFAGSLAKCRTGDLSLVAKSDALLSRYEGLAPVTRKTKTIASVAGGCPNVGAYLAGSPVAMRRRQQMIDDAGPLVVIVDTTCSGGMTEEQLTRRGSAILALVRLLSLARPVSLYVGCSLAGGGTGKKRVAHIYAAIDTAPLDLARSAHVLSSPTFNRALLYGLATDLTGATDPYVQWPYDTEGTTMRQHAHKILGRVIQGEEFLFVPGAHLNHQNVQRPEKWLTDMLKKYGANDVDAEAA